MIYGCGSCIIHIDKKGQSSQMHLKMIFISYKVIDSDVSQCLMFNQYISMRKIHFLELGVFFSDTALRALSGVL